MDFSDARKKLPQLSNLDDEQFLNVVHKVYYPDMDRTELASRLGYKAPEAPVKQAGVLRTAGDVGIKLAQGVVDLGQSVVGVGDLATGGAVGNALGSIGYDPKGTNEFLGEYLSDSQKAADAKVQAADGFMDSIAASIQNPRSILGAVTESLPGMALGMGGSAALAGKIGLKAALATAEGQAAATAARAAGKTAAQAAAAAAETTAGKAAAQQAIDAAGTRLLAAGSGIEGAQSAGQIADQAREAGRSYSDYALPAVAAGLGTAAIGLGAGKLMGDSATHIATGAQSTGVKGGLAARVGKEFLSEGVLEEMPQSAQEQVWTNMANGDDLDKGVGNAAGTGLITGGVMGAGLGGFQKHETGPATPAPVELPNTGPLSQAANAGQAAQAAAAAQQAAQQAPATPAAPAAPAQSAAPVAPAQMPLDAIDARLSELRAIGRGTPDEKIQNEDGTTTTVPGITPRRYTQAERDEFDTLVSERRKRVSMPPEQMDEYHQLLREEAAAQPQPGADLFTPPAPAPAAEQEAEIQRMLAEEAAQRRAAEREAQQREMETTNAIIEHDMRQRAAANRKALRDDVLGDDWTRIADKKGAFAAAMAREGYKVPELNDEDHAAFDAHAASTRAAALDQVLKDDSIPADQKADGFAQALYKHGFADLTPTDAELDAINEATAPIPAAPNQLVDAVPERVESAPAPASGTNTAAVDAAIASGMRLKTANGSVLHKKGSSKIFKLSSAQKAYYLERMAALEGAQAEAAPAETAPSTSAAAALDAPARPAPPAPTNEREAAYDAALARHNAAVDRYKAAQARGDQAAMNAARAEAGVERGKMQQAALGGIKEELSQQSAQRTMEEAKRLAAMPIGTRARPSEFSEEQGLYFEKTGQDEWTGRGDWFQAGKTRTNMQMAERGGFLFTEPSPEVQAIDAAAHEAATSPHNDRPEPTQAQKEAGNYKKGHVRLHGLEISIENPAGSVRKGVDPDGKPWETTMANHYGDILGTHGADGDPVDVFIGPRPKSERVFVVDQYDHGGRKFDEHKVMLGFDTLEQAREAYSSNYDADWKGGKRIVETDIAGLKEWLTRGEAKGPLADAAPANAEIHDFRARAADEGVQVAPAAPAPAQRPMPADYTRNVIHNAREWGFSGADLVPDEMGHIPAHFENIEVFTTQSIVPGSTNAPVAMIKVAPAPNGKWTSALSYTGPQSGQSVGLGIRPGYDSREDAIRAQLAKLKGNVKPAVYADMERAVGLAPSKQVLNKMTVKDMTDEQLLQARTVMADTPRAAKIDKEIERRGLDKKDDAAPAPAAVEQEQAAPEEATPAPVETTATEQPVDAKSLSTAPEHARMDGTGPKSGQFTSDEFRAAADRIKELQKQRDEILAEHGEYFVGKGSGRKPTKEAPPEVADRWKEFKREWNKASDAYNAALTVPKFGTASGNPVEGSAPIDETIVPMTMDKASFAKITDEWADLFAEPAADERVRLDLKTLPEVMEPAEAAAQVEAWKEHARRQGETHRSENSQRTVLSLFDLSGEWSKPWREAGYNVVQFDIQSGQDVFDFNVEYFTENYDLSDVYCILAATPCTDFASSGAKHFLKKDEAGQTEQSVELVNQTARTIEYFRPAVWALENPVGRLSNVTGLPSPRLMFQPHAFGDPYTKETWIWGRFNPELPTANVFPTEGSKMHSLYGGKSIETKNARSETPEGFAYAFFMANNYVDMPVEKKLAAEYPEASGAIAEALKAGVTESEIHELMDRTYGDYDYEAARNVLIQAVADRKKGSGVNTDVEPALDAPQAAPAEATPPAPAPEVDHDDGKDIPKAFYKKVKVPHDVWVEDERRYETIEIQADKALASVREDIDNLKSLLGCMKG